MKDEKFLREAINRGMLITNDDCITLVNEIDSLRTRLESFEKVNNWQDKEIKRLVKELNK